MYTTINFKTKKELKQAVARRMVWEKVSALEPPPNTLGAVLLASLPTPPRVTYYQPGPFGGAETRDGTVYLEGPHSPEPHKWYASATVRNGAIVSVK